MARVLERAELAAENVRGNLRLEGPVSAFEVAKALKMRVHMDRLLPRRGMTCLGSPDIFVRDGDRATRLEHACAHEIGHHHVFDQRSQFLEKACNRFAAALLLPAYEVRRDVAELGSEPFALARKWRFSSVEAIARRLAEVVPGVGSAAWLELEPKWRQGRAPPAGRRELEAVSEAYCRPRGTGYAELPCGLLRVWRTGTGPRSAVSVLQAA